MAKFDREYVIPLGIALRAPRLSRANRAMIAVRDFVRKHAKADEVNISTSINESVWTDGIMHPPKRLRVHVLKDDETNIAYVALPGDPIIIPSEEEKAAKEKEKEEKKAAKEEEKKAAKEEEKKAASKEKGKPEPVVVNEESASQTTATIAKAEPTEKAGTKPEVEEHTA